MTVFFYIYPYLNPINNSQSTNPRLSGDDKIGCNVRQLFERPTGLLLTRLISKPSGCIEDNFTMFSTLYYTEREDWARATFDLKICMGCLHRQKMWR